jgi:hypothetical protein
MSPVATTQWPPTRPATRASAPVVVIAVLTAAVVGLGLLPHMDTAPHVDAVTFENPNAVEVNVDVTDEQLGGWVGVGPVEAEESETIEEVYDPGAVWVFRFLAPGLGGDQVEMTREDLEAADWQVTVPDFR